MVGHVLIAARVILPQPFAIVGVRKTNVDAGSGGCGVGGTGGYDSPRAFPSLVVRPCHRGSGGRAVTVPHAAVGLSSGRFLTRRYRAPADARGPYPAL